MAEVVIPVLNSNDEEYVLTEWVVADGVCVRPGEVIAIIETSKAATELTCTEAGALRHLIPAMTGCRPGEVVARTFPTQPTDTTAQESAHAPAVPADHGESAVTVTAAALALMRQHDLSAADVARPGMRLIRRVDVESALKRTAPSDMAPGDPLPRHQQAVARVVSKSHATVPSAFLAIKAPAPWVPRPGQKHQTSAVNAGVTELVIKAVAAAASEFPLMFAQVLESLRTTAATSVDIGVTIDLGRGLSIPAIRQADLKSVAQIAGALAALRVRAMRGKLTDADMGKPCIVVALQQEPGVILSVPVIYPGNVCAISVGALDWGLIVGDSSQPVLQASFTLGISYDHRVVNGRDAALFLAHVRDRVLREATGTQPDPASTPGPVRK